MTYRTRRRVEADASRRWHCRPGRWLLVGAVGLLGPAIFAGSAGATGPYPGETLSVAQSGPAVAGQATNFVASGQQTDVNDYAGGFSLDVFEKDPTVDPTCAASYWDETNNAITDPSELHFIVGDWQGTDTTFSVPFKAVFAEAGTGAAVRLQHVDHRHCSQRDADRECDPGADHERRTDAEPDSNAADHAVHGRQAGERDASSRNAAAQQAPVQPRVMVEFAGELLVPLAGPGSPGARGEAAPADRLALAAGPSGALQRERH